MASNFSGLHSPKKGQGLKNNSSLAHKCIVFFIKQIDGISASSSAFKQNQYGSTSAPSSKFGLNPNLNIQDEYIENLLKQTHFMNMEIKLLKQKQAQSNNNALWGIVNRTNEPLIKNVVDSSQKYQLMKKNLDQQRQQLITDNIRLADEQNAILKEYEYLENKLGAVAKRKDNANERFREQSSKIIEKVTDYQKRLKSITEERQLQKKKHNSSEAQLQEITNEKEKQQSKTDYDLSKIRNDEIIQQQMQQQMDAAIDAVKFKIGNEDYQKASTEQEALRERIDNLEKSISGAKFNLMQLDESIKMADIEREKEVKQRKLLTEEFESTKMMLVQILFMNFGRKQKQCDNRKKQSPEIQKAEYQTRKLQASLDEIKKKLLKCQDTQNTLRMQVEALERQLSKLKAKRQALKLKFEQISKQNETEQGIIQNATSQIRKLEDQHQKASNQQYMLSCELQETEKNLQYTRGRRDYLTETLNLKDTLDGAKLEQLQRVVQKNNDLNHTVGLLMGKWEEIKSFSRM